MTWIEYIKQYMSGHPTVKWSEAMKRCKAPWAKYKEHQKHMPKYWGKAHIPGQCEETDNPIKLSKRRQDIIKDECGIQLLRKKITPYGIPQKTKTKQKTS